jgi:hypothetical protein
LNDIVLHKYVVCFILINFALALKNDLL